MVGGEILAAPGDELGNLLPSFFFFPDALEAGVDLPEAGLSGSFLLPGPPPPSEPAIEPLADPGTEAPFSLGDLVPLVGGGSEPGFDQVWSLTQFYSVTFSNQGSV